MAISLRDYLWMNRGYFTMTEFAAKLEITPTYLSHVANGSIIPSMVLSKRIEKETNGAVRWNELLEFCYNSKEKKRKLT